MHSRSILFWQLLKCVDREAMVVQAIVQNRMTLQCYRPNQLSRESLTSAERETHRWSEWGKLQGPTTRNGLRVQWKKEMLRYASKLQNDNATRWKSPSNQLSSRRGIIVRTWIGTRHWWEKLREGTGALHASNLSTRIIGPCHYLLIVQVLESRSVRIF